MTPESEVSRLTTIRRFRGLAAAALEAYGLGDARFELLRVAGNVLFRVFEPALGAKDTNDCPFKPGQYLLRIHDCSEQQTDAIQVEVEWLAAIRRDLGLYVPEPRSALDGRLMVRVSTPQMPAARDCTLLRWLKGRRVTTNVRPAHFLAQGRIMARLHNHAAVWSAPTDQAKRRFDYEGLFCDDAGAGLPNSDAWALLPDRHRQAYELVAEKIKHVMKDWGKGPHVYGLIHGDCGIDANVLFWKGQAQVIDFDGSGFGYYLYDLALALEHCWEQSAYPRYLEALLKGYSEFRSIPAAHLRYMDLFRAAFYVYMGLWTVALDQMHPDSPNRNHRHERWLRRGMRFIERFHDPSRRT